MSGGSLDEDVVVHVISALGIRTIRVPDLAERVILFTRYRLALIDADATREEWEALLDAVLSAMAPKEVAL